MLCLYVVISQPSNNSWLSWQLRYYMVGQYCRPTVYYGQPNTGPYG